MYLYAHLLIVLVRMVSSMQLKHIGRKRERDRGGGVIFLVANQTQFCDLSVEVEREEGRN